MGTSLQLNAPLIPYQEGIDAYIQRVMQVPLLTQEEETALAKAYREKGDLQAAHQMTIAHLRYVVSVARSYGGYGLPLADLIQEGTVGLMKAVKRFEPEKGVRLVSFAVHWIKAEIHEYVIKNWRIVKVATTKAQRKLFFNLRKAKKRLGWFSGEEVSQVAQDLKVSEKEVLEMESRLLNGRDCAFDGPVNESKEEGEWIPAQCIEGDVNEEPLYQLEGANWQGLQSQKLQEALLALDPRSAEIVTQRWLSEQKETLKSLAQRFEISIERVRQLEATALKHLKEALSS